MKAMFSPWLQLCLPALRAVVEELGREYEYVSALSTDSVGFSVSISRARKNVSGRNMTTERGTVLRVCRNGLYSEYAFNDWDPAAPEMAAAAAKQALERQFRLLEKTGTRTFRTGALQDEPLELFVEKEAEILPEETDMAALVEEFTALSEEGLRTIPGAIDCGVSASSTHISKLFLTKNRCLRQSYVYTEGSVFAYAPAKEGDTKVAFSGVSGCGDPEILQGLREKLQEMPKTMEELVGSERIVPGEYEIIADPGIAGLIAHEAFGHGVEMDMFVKKRALGAEYIGKRVGSDLVTMHEGALCEESVTAYAFDDEGTPAGDVTEIDHGILKTGICDALSALRLGVEPTGNGKRENYAHKA